MKNKLRLGIPKGSLQESTQSLFKKAGWNIRVGERELTPLIDDPDLEGLLIRAQEMAGYVEKGVLDCGLTGRDWVMEQGAKVKEICPLIYSKVGLRRVKWVVAVPENSPIKSPRGLKGKRIATEVVSIAKGYLKKKGIQAQVEFSWGATEAKAPLLADAIIEVTETGSSLLANNLRIIDTVLWSETVFIANKGALKNTWKRNKIETMALMLTGALEAEGKAGLKMNVPEKALDKVTKILPALHTPTLASLSDPEWFSLEVVVDENVVRDLIPRLKRAGATGIIEYPLNKVIP
jgi:ATP phosphoribosyltransferase